MMMVQLGHSKGALFMPQIIPIKDLKNPDTASRFLAGLKQFMILAAVLLLTAMAWHPAAA